MVQSPEGNIQYFLIQWAVPGSMDSTRMSEDKLQALDLYLLHRYQTFSLPVEKQTEAIALEPSLEPMAEEIKHSIHQLQEDLREKLEKHGTSMSSLQPATVDSVDKSCSSSTFYQLRLLNGRIL